MKHLWKISVALLLYFAALYLLGRGKKETVAQESNVAATESIPGSSSQSPSTPTEDPLFARQTVERIQQLTHQAEHRAKTEQAKKEMAPSRRQIQTASYAAWKRVIDNNQTAYLLLKARAETAPQGEVPCTICDGFSYMPCVACVEHKGKCVSCNGSGRRTGGEYCASCLRTGKCYLCTGSGKMFCPFCDDGMINSKRPPPSGFLPPY